jgi:hypothetical protein
MTKPVLFADIIKGATTFEKEKVLDAIQAAAPTLPAADLKVLIQALSNEVRAQEAKTSKNTARMQRLSAAMQASASGDGKAMNSVLKAQRGLRDLGLSDDLDANAKKGYSISAIDTAMRAAAWKQEQRIEFKSRLDSLGLLS